MRASAMFPSPFLRKDDFPTPTVLTIKRVSMESVAKGEEKPVIFFNEFAKGMVLNKTKTKLLEASFGDDTDTWTGKKVRLSADPDVRDLAGNIVGGIKLECSKTRPVATPAPAPAPVAAPPPVVIGDDLNDDSIPF